MTAYLSTGSIRSPAQSPSMMSPASRGRQLAWNADGETDTYRRADVDMRGVKGQFNSVFKNAAFDSDRESSPRALSPVGRKTPFAQEAAQSAPWASPSQSKQRSPNSTLVGFNSTNSSPPRGRGSLQHGASAQYSTNGTMIEAMASARENFSEDGEPVVIAKARSDRVSQSGALLFNSQSVQQWENEVKRLIASNNKTAAMTRPAPSDGMVQCYVKRVKNWLGQITTYTLHLDTGDVFLLAARKRKKSKASTFIVSTNASEMGKDSDYCISKLKANFVGTEYELASRGGKTEFGQEELCIFYKQTALSVKGGPRMMSVAIPLPEYNWTSSAPDGSDSLLGCLEQARKRELPPHQEKKLAILANRPPEWDGKVKAYTLDFKGRVKAASVKNFQLVHWDHNTDQRGSDIVLQFGKQDEDTFALDFTYPLNLKRAFAIALASLDSKLCYAM